MPKSDKYAEAILKLIFWNSVVAGDTPAGPDVLDHFGAGTQLRISTTPGNLYVGLHTASPGYGGLPSTSEISYTTYARLITTRDNNATTGWQYGTTGGPNMSNRGDLTFGQMTGGTGGAARFWSIVLDSSGTGAATDLLYFDALNLSTPKVFAAPDLPADATFANNFLVVPGHGFSIDDNVTFRPAGGMALPGGLTEGTWYYVTDVSDPDMIKVSTIKGGSAVDINTTVGGGYVQKALEQTVGVNNEPTIKAGKLIVYER